MNRRWTVRVALMTGWMLCGGLQAGVRADPPSAAQIQDARGHFQRGVTLYNEADYRAALVEFQRAYQIAPNAAVLYNIGQAYFQLQHYAGALTAFERYLRESDGAAAHEDEVEHTLETLRARVGELTVTASEGGCEVTIDDEPAGKTPLPGPILVSIGRRRVITTCHGRPADTRLVDVAAGDTVPVTVAIAEPIAPAQLPPKLAAPPVPPPPAAPARPARREGRRRATVAWITTGALGAAAATTGVLAFLASRDLQDARDSFPVSHDVLVHKSSRVKSLALSADLLGAATVVAGGVALGLTLSRSRTHEVHVALAPGGLQLAGSFR